MSKVALITGITGQDGSYLAELLLSKGYKVHGIVRRVALEDETHRLWRIKHLLNKIEIESASLESYASIVKIIQKIKPDEMSNFAGCFLTGTAAVTPVSQIAQHNFKVCDTILDLSDSYQKVVRKKKAA